MQICSRLPPSLFKQRPILFLKIEDHSLQRSLSLFILWMCCVIDSFSSWIDSGTSLYTTSFKWPQRKMSKGFRSGEFGAQTKLVFRLITRSPKFVASQFLEACAVWGGVPSCINHWFSITSLRQRRHILNFFKMGIYLSEVTG